MNGYLLDTNLISELVKPEPEPNVIKWIESIDESLMFLSALTLGEIKRGILQLQAAKRKARLEAWLNIDLQLRFSNRILGIDNEIAILWGELSATSLSQGSPISVIDGLIAATAIRNDLQLVTRNIKDFAKIQIALVDPWKN